MANTTNTRPVPESRIYDVELGTVLGRRSGQLKLQLSGGRLFGILGLMNAENPVHGRVSPDGACRLAGSIRTRMSAYSFEGEGIMLSERIEMLLRCKGLSLPLRGIRREE